MFSLLFQGSRKRFLPSKQLKNLKLRTCHISKAGLDMKTERLGKTKKLRKWEIEAMGMMKVLTKTNSRPGLPNRNRT